MRSITGLMSCPGGTNPVRDLGQIPSSRCVRSNVRTRLRAVRRPRWRAKPCSKMSENRAVAGSRRLAENGGARRDRTDDLLLAKQALSQLSYGPLVCRPIPASARRLPLRQGGSRGLGSHTPAPPRHTVGGAWPNGMVGLGRLELPTSRLSGVRSNHLSYRPESKRAHKFAHLLRRKRNEDGGIPPFIQRFSPIPRAEPVV